LAWARANHTDPLALKMEKLAERLSAADEEAGGVTIRKGAGPAALAMTGLMFAVVAGAFAWMAKPVPPPVPKTADEIALTMVGRWAEVGLGDCAADALTLSLEPEGLALGDATIRVGKQIVSLEDNWVRLGDGSRLRRNGANLERKASETSEARQFTPCK
jgi:hypothetical protein